MILLQKIDEIDEWRISENQNHHDPITEKSRQGTSQSGRQQLTKFVPIPTRSPSSPGNLSGKSLSDGSRSMLAGLRSGPFDDLEYDVGKFYTESDSDDDSDVDEETDLFRR